MKATVILGVLTLMMFSSAFAVGNTTTSDVYDMLVLYNNDIQERFDEMETRMDNLESHVDNSTSALRVSDQQGRDLLIQRTQPLHINLLNIVFIILAGLIFFFFMARHERRLYAQYKGGAK